MKTILNFYRRVLESWLILFWLIFATWTFCGCSSVQPELTPEERVYNEELKKQSARCGPSPTTDMRLGEKDYFWWLAQQVLYGMAGGGPVFPK